MDQPFQKYWRDGLVMASIIIPAGMLFFACNGGDEAIYFTNFRNFFFLPFSYQPDTVSSGATSPLQVLLFGQATPVEFGMPGGNTFVS